MASISDTDRAFTLMAQGAAANTALDLLADMVAKQQEQLSKKAFFLIDQGTLTAEQAMLLWHEKHALNKIIKGLLDRVKAAQAGAQFIKENVDG